MKMNYILSFLLTMITVGIVRADVQTDRLINRISRDIQTYVSAECRARTQQEAYDNALEDLTRQIVSYMRMNKREITDTELAEISNHFQRLDSPLSDNRYRVFIYVKKSDLIPSGNSYPKEENSSKSDDPVGGALTWAQRKTMIEQGDVSPQKPIGSLWPPVISDLARITEKDSLVSALTVMRKDKRITGAAAFPIADIGDFYLAIVNEGKVTHIIHVLDGKWTDALSGKEYNPADLPSSSSAYWFTLPK